MIFTTRTKETKSAVRSVADLDADLLAWRDRRAQLGQDLQDARAREREAAERRGQLVGELVPDAAEVKKARQQHAAVAGECEELELALASVDERLRNLDAERAQAEHRRRVTAALTALDRAGAIAARVDAAWDPIRDELVRLIQAADDSVVALKTVFPTGHSFEMGRARLRATLLWRISDLIDLGYLSASDRISAAELVSWAPTRAQLEQELAGQGQEERA